MEMGEIRDEKDLGEWIDVQGQLCHCFRIGIGCFQLSRIIHSTACHIIYILYGLVARIPVFHTGGPGSIPGGGTI